MVSDCPNTTETLRSHGRHTSTGVARQAEEFKYSVNEQGGCTLARDPGEDARVHAFSRLSTASSRGRGELFSQLSNLAEPRITHSTATFYFDAFSRGSARSPRIKDLGIPRARTLENIDSGPRRDARSVDRSQAGFAFGESAGAELIRVSATPENTYFRCRS